MSYDSSIFYYSYSLGGVFMLKTKSNNFADIIADNFLSYSRQVIMDRVLSMPKPRILCTIKVNKDSSLKVINNG